MSGVLCFTAEFKDNEVNSKTLYCLSYVLFGPQKSYLIFLHTAFILFLSLFLSLFLQMKHGLCHS